MKQLIYADNAATTKLDNLAFEDMKEYLLNDYSNPSQPYLFSKKSKLALKNSRQIIANCINANSNEILFTSGGSESNNISIKCSLNDNKTKVITSSIEHHSILNACNQLKNNDIDVIYLKPNQEGVIALDSLISAIDNNTKLVSIMFANNEIGTIQNIKELCKVAHKYNALFHVDAVQAIGHINIDVKELDIDLLSASAHKFNGPKGIGFLYIKQGVSITPLISGGSQEFGLRGGTENVASIVGMATALKNNILNISENEKLLFQLEELVINKLNSSNIDYIRNGSKNHIPGNLSLSFSNITGEMLLHRLDFLGICISTGSACDGHKDQVSHVINEIKVSDKYKYGTIRISFGKNNSLKDAENIADGIIQVLNSIKKTNY